MSVQLSGSLAITGSIYATQGITGSFSGSATSASYADTLQGLGSASFAPAGTFNTVSQSFATTSGSIASRVNVIETSYATTGSNNFTKPQQISDVSNAISFTSTASLYTAGGMRVGKDSFVSGTAYFNNIVVYGTSSIQYITSSQLDISDNIIAVNTFTPAVRFGGLAVYDSGSTSLTGSMLWDSEMNRWVYSNPSGSTYDGGMIISGPRNTSGLGNEQGTTACALMMGQGGDHITSSAILSYGNATCFYGQSYISSSGAACFASTICAGDSILTKNSLYVTTNDGAGKIIYLNGNSTHYNWLLAAQQNIDNAFEITPTTTVGGSTYSSPVLTIYYTGLSCFKGIVCAPNFVASSTCSTAGLRVYGASGTHQWDMYLNGTNLRFSDNTSGGCFVVDTAAMFGSSVSGTSVRSNGVGTFGFNTANNGEFQIYATALDGMIMAGRGSSNDMVITNKSGSDVFRIPTGTTTANFVGQVGIGITSPNATLDINAAGGLGGWTGFRLKYGTSSVQSLSMGQVTAGNGAWIGTAQYYQGGFWQTEGTAASVLVFNSDGSFNINTNSGLTANTNYNLSPRITVASTGAVTFSCKVGVAGASATYPLTVYNGSNGTTAAFGGTTYGIRIDNDGTFSCGRSTIYGVDASFYGSYQPLAIGASALYFSIAGTDKLTINSSGIACFANKIMVNGSIESLTDASGEGGQVMLRGTSYQYGLDNYGGCAFRVFREDDGTGASGLVLMSASKCGNIGLRTNQSIGATDNYGSIANNSFTTFNINGAGGDNSIGFIAFGARRLDASCGAVRMWAQYHTAGANGYSSILGRDEGGIFISNTGSGVECIINCSGGSVCYSIRYISLISASTLAGI